MSERQLPCAKRIPILAHGGKTNTQPGPVNPTDSDWKNQLTPPALALPRRPCFRTGLFQDSKTKSENAKGLAAEYLASKLHLVTDPYQMAILTYALQRAGHRDRDVAFIKLRQMARRGARAR